MIRVLVAAVSVITRAGLEALITANSALTVVGMSSITTLAQQAEVLQPDVVLLELGQAPLPELFALDAELHDLAVVVLIDDPQGDRAIEALRSGIQGVLPLEVTAEEIVAAVEAVAAGLVVVHPDLIDLLLLTPPATRVLPGELNQALTPREIEVLGMLAEGLGNKTIARRLGISEHTVKFHVSSIFSKLNVSSRTEAVTLGARQGLIML